jgi:hypothetical protein
MYLVDYQIEDIYDLGPDRMDKIILESDIEDRV